MLKILQLTRDSAWWINHERKLHKSHACFVEESMRTYELYKIRHVRTYVHAQANIPEGMTTNHHVVMTKNGRLLSASVTSKLPLSSAISFCHLSPLFLKIALDLLLLFSPHFLLFGFTLVLTLLEIRL